MANYTQDPNGIVHLLDPLSGGEFTYCSLDSSQNDSGGFIGKDHGGPASCADCKEHVDALRKSILGVKWRVK